MRVFTCAAALLTTLAVLLLSAPILSSAETAPAPAAVPDAAAQAAAHKLVLEIYKDEIAKATKPEDKIALARKLLKAASETKNDPAGCYVLISTAKDLAVAGHDADVALAAVGQMAAAFEIDLLGAKLDTLTKVLAEARRANDTAAVAKVSAQLTDLKEAKANYERIKGALTVLEKNPTDPTANLAVGKFFCFNSGDWDKGLPMLALGNDTATKALADKELAKPTDSDKQLELADGWWDISVKQTGVVQTTVQAHAAEWYAKALPNLTGLVKTKAEKRINDADKGRPLTGKTATIDLLALVDPAQDSVKGLWQLKDGGLWVGNSRWARVRIPYKPSEEYDLQYTFTRVENGDAIVCILNTGGRQFTFGVEHYKNTLAGVDFIKGVGIEKNGTGIKMTLRTGQKHTVLAQIRKDEFKAFVDGRLVNQFKTDYRDMALWTDWGPADASSLGLGSSDAATFFQDVKLIEVTGKGHPTRDPATPK